VPFLFIGDNMKELTNEKTMTIKEIAELLNVDEVTVNRKINELYPLKIKNGIKTVLTYLECHNIISEIKKKGIIAPLQNAKLDLNEIMKNPDFFRKIADVIERNNELENKMIEIKPKADYTDQVLLTEDLFSATQIAQDLGISAKRLNELLEEENIIYKSNGQWILKTEYKNKGFVKSRTHLFYDKENNQHSILHTYWTQTGRKFILDNFKASEKPLF
jgi:phage antirepressor YoqD-like protein